MWARRRSYRCCAPAEFVVDGRWGFTRCRYGGIWTAASRGNMRDVNGQFFFYLSPKNAWEKEVKNIKKRETCERKRDNIHIVRHIFSLLPIFSKRKLLNLKKF